MVGISALPIAVPCGLQLVPLKSFATESRILPASRDIRPSLPATTADGDKLKSSSHTVGIPDQENVGRPITSGPEFIKISLESLRDPRLSPGAKLLEGRIACYIGKNPDGVCWASQETLADDLGIKSRQVRNLLSELRESGRLEWRRTKRGTCRYRLLDRQASATQGTQEAQERQLNAAKTGNILPDHQAINCRQKEVLKEQQSPHPVTEKRHDQVRSVNPLALAVERTAIRIHTNHPHGIHQRRNLSVSEIKKQLAAILRFRRLSGAEAIAYLDRLGSYHETLSRSESWTKEGCQYAPALSNWLRPTKNRYDPPAQVDSKQPQSEAPGISGTELLEW